MPEIALHEIVSVTIILFSIIDVPGNLPVIIGLKEGGSKIEPAKTAVACGLIMVAFLFVGEVILSLYGVDVGSFAVAGAIVLFLVGLEMILGASFFKQDPVANSSASIFPLAFPLMAGAGTLTTLISLKAEYETLSLLIGILVNVIIIFLAIRASDWLHRKLGPQGSIVVRKIFGIILIAIAIRLIKSHLLTGFVS